jgi:general secretion pathway protein G
MKRKEAFTLVEILIVVIILGILAAIVIPQFTEASDDARLSALSSDLQTIRAQLELYKMQHGGAYPADLVTALTTAAGGYGPYLTKFPSNPFVSGATSDDVDTTTLGGSTAGWFYDASDGTVKPDDDDHTDL